MNNLDRFLDQLPYGDRIMVTRPGEGAQDADGVYTPAAAPTVLFTPCDVQRYRYRDYRDQEGDVLKDADAICYLPATAALKYVRPGDRAVVEQGSMVRTARVVELLVFEHAVTLAFL